jgi:hypothetical protein
MDRITAIRNLFDEANSSSLNKNHKLACPEGDISGVLASCPHIASFHQDGEPHLAWMMKGQFKETHFFIKACANCVSKLSLVQEKDIIWRTPLLILSEDDSRLSAAMMKTDGYKVEAVSEKGRRILQSIGN